jgi:hypothetical protein
LCQVAFERVALVIGGHGLRAEIDHQVFRGLDAEHRERVAQNLYLTRATVKCGVRNAQKLSADRLVGHDDFFEICRAVFWVVGIELNDLRDNRGQGGDC